MIKIEAGEKSLSKTTAEKQYLIKTNIDEHIYRVICTLRQPKNVGEITIEQDGRSIPAARVDEDDQFAYYQFLLEKFTPFVIKKQ
jgi:hypothetical protein